MKSTLDGIICCFSVGSIMCGTMQWIEMKTVLTGTIMPRTIIGLSSKLTLIATRLSMSVVAKGCYLRYFSHMQKKLLESNRTRMLSGALQKVVQITKSHPDMWWFCDARRFSHYICLYHLCRFNTPHGCGSRIEESGIIAQPRWQNSNRRLLETEIGNRIVSWNTESAFVENTVGDIWGIRSFCRLYGINAFSVRNDNYCTETFQQSYCPHGFILSWPDGTSKMNKTIPPPAVMTSQ